MPGLKHRLRNRTVKYSRVAAIRSIIVSVPLFFVGLVCASEETFSVEAVRHAGNPLITPASSPILGNNINGPSVVRVPEWVSNPLGNYYMYFAHHQGEFIRLAYADHPAGPWKVYPEGVIRVSDTEALEDHIASPDVHIDKNQQRILMFVHGHVAGDDRQGTILTTSRDGIRFFAQNTILGSHYFKAFQHHDWWYAIANTGVLYRSKDPAQEWEKRDKRLIPLVTIKDKFGIRGRVRARHSAVIKIGNKLIVFYSRKKDAPERILAALVDLSRPWTDWKPGKPVEVLRPDRPFEGVEYPLKPSEPGEATHVQELRDPAILRDNDRIWLYYSIAGESGIAVAEVEIGGVKE